MPCFHPLTAYQSHLDRTANGKKVIVFDITSADKGPGTFEKIKLPCGQCLGCRIDSSKSWAIRVVHEASLYENNAFITLTFSPSHLNKRGTLVRSDFQRFMKRLRKDQKGTQYVTPVSPNANPYPIRYFHCGEYGSKLHRPHHHACLFNFAFADQELWSDKKGIKLYRSKTLEKLWPQGHSTIGDVTYESAAYVARYVTKKYNGMHAAEHYIRGDPNLVDPETGEMDAYFLEPEYITMSSRPGIGSAWYDKHPNDVFPKDFVTHKGKRIKTPSYYDNKLDKVDPEQLLAVKAKRKLAAQANCADNTVDRLRARAAVAHANYSKFVREYEDGSEDV